jgi:competence protein ComEA
MSAIPRVSRARAVAYLAVLLALLALGGRFLVNAMDNGRARSAQGRASGSLSVVEAADESATGSLTAIETAAGPPLLVVHVVGAVRRPGLYRLQEGSRVADAIRKAGGARAVAVLALVNLAAPIADGQQIVVPRADPSGDSAGAEPSALPEPEAPVGPVHLNSATLEQLDALPGVGPVTAERILAYRDEHGSFGSVDELDAVPGIGPARLEQLRELVVV